MIEVVEGGLGSGKTLYAVMQIERALRRGQYVVTNIALYPEWADVMFGKRRADRFRHRLVNTDSLQEVMRMRVPPCGKCKRCRQGMSCTAARGVLLWDEIHNEINARTWDVDDTGRDRTRKEVVVDRRNQVRHFSQTRKLGFDVLLITQDRENIDTQVRRNYEFVTRMVNLRRQRYAGIPVCPFDFFIAIRRWNNKAQTIQGREFFLRHRRHSECYDTMATSHGLDRFDPDAIYLGGRAAHGLAEAQPARTGDSHQLEEGPLRPE